MVPEFEEREAAIFVLCTWSEFMDLDWQERAAAIAHYRMHLLVESHVQDIYQSDAARKGSKN